MTTIKTDLENIKVAVFDFDDTLAIHLDRGFFDGRRSNGGSYLDYYTEAYLNPENFYEDNERCVPSEELKKLIVALREKGVKIYCLSGMKFSFHLKAKQSFVGRHYGDDIEVFSSSGQEMKVDAVKILAHINNCGMEEILFIDDLEENIARMREMGVRAVLPSEVALLVA